MGGNFGNTRGKQQSIKYWGNNPAKSLGKGFEWRGKSSLGGDKENWYNPKTGEKWNMQEIILDFTECKYIVQLYYNFRKDFLQKLYAAKTHPQTTAIVAGNDKHCGKKAYLNFMQRI